MTACTEVSSASGRGVGYLNLSQLRTISRITSTMANSAALIIPRIKRGFISFSFLISWQLILSILSRPVLRDEAISP